jgi:nicotinamidase-related amidase
MSKYLIVVDVQKDFVDGALGTPEAQAIIQKGVRYEKNHHQFNP